MEISVHLIPVLRLLRGLTSFLLADFRNSSNRQMSKLREEQSAYQSKKGGADHVFVIRCLIQHTKRLKQKLYIIPIDFDGAFGRVSRLLLICKLILFGAGTVFVSCLASIYMRTDSIMYRNNDHIYLYHHFYLFIYIYIFIYIFYILYLYFM